MPEQKCTFVMLENEGIKELKKNKPQTGWQRVNVIKKYKQRINKINNYKLSDNHFAVHTEEVKNSEYKLSTTKFVLCITM